MEETTLETYFTMHDIDQLTAGELCEVLCDLITKMVVHEDESVTSGSSLEE